MGGAYLYGQMVATHTPTTFSSFPIPQVAPATGRPGPNRFNVPPRPTHYITASPPTLAAPAGPAPVQHSSLDVSADEVARRIASAPTKTKLSAEGNHLVTRTKWSKAEVRLARSRKVRWMAQRLAATGHTAARIERFLKEGSPKAFAAWEEIIDRIKATGIDRSREGIQKITFTRLGRPGAAKSNTRKPMAAKPRTSKPRAAKK